MDSLLDVQVNELVAFQLTVDGVRNLHGRMWCHIRFHAFYREALPVQNLLEIFLSKAFYKPFGDYMYQWISTGFLGKMYYKHWGTV